MSEYKIAAWRTSFALMMGAISLAGWSGQAMAISDDGRYEACPRCEPKNLAWSQGQYDQVYLMPVQAKNNHPQNLNAEPLARLLGKITLQVGGKSFPLLGDDAAGELARGLVAAVAKAEPQHDVTFFITSRGNTGIFANRVGHSGTAFVDDKGLNLIFGEANVDFFTAYKASHIPRPFAFGSRARASGVTLAGEGMAHPRGDWVIVPLGAPAVPPPPPQTVGGPVNTQAVSDTRVYQSVSNTAAPLAKVPPAVAPAAAAPASSASGQEGFFQAQEARLKNLKRLREQGLITDDEYQAKRKEILKDL